jgi:hypothetical protein
MEATTLIMHGFYARNAMMLSIKTKFLVIALYFSKRILKKKHLKEPEINANALVIADVIKSVK